MQQETDSSLPIPDATSAAHSVRVGDYIRKTIAGAGGLISFAEYMHLALYAPGLGYYSAGTTKFGKAGDFVTAPEVSPVFGRVLARQCASVLAELDAPCVLEFGAGSGKLAGDLLQALAELDALPQSYQILEVSADLRQRQESYLMSELPELADKVTWLDQLPDEHTGVIVANEVLDAMPVERFARLAEGSAQLCVGFDGEKFLIEQRPAPDVLAAAIRQIEIDLGRRLPIGYVSEVCLAVPGWIGDLARLLKQGVAFLFDYGVSRREYYAEDRTQGWLRCHFRHHAHNDPLILPGIQDLTAWVDFSTVAAAAVDHGLEIAGFVTQAQFLIGGGLAEELEGLTDLPLTAQLQLSGQVKLLTLPGEMGENFKCLGLSRGMDTSLSAFAVADRTAAL
ncbi:MAG: SAM-dependent methyltransferase [Proteobacteria bacterium]|nr:SAM-dependent methyltransferase [Pseudomonadota bacterium]